MLRRSSTAAEMFADENSPAILGPANSNLLSKGWAGSRSLPSSPAKHALKASPLTNALGGNNGADAIAALKAKLFAAEQRAAVLEGEKRALQAQVEAADDLKWLLSCPGVAQASKLEEREAMPGRQESEETLSHAVAHSQALAKQVEALTEQLHTSNLVLERFTAILGGAGAARMEVHVSAVQCGEVKLLGISGEDVDVAAKLTIYFAPGDAAITLPGRDQEVPCGAEAEFAPLQVDLHLTLEGVLPPKVTLAGDEAGDEAATSGAAGPPGLEVSASPCRRGAEDAEAVAPPTVLGLGRRHAEDGELGSGPLSCS